MKNVVIASALMLASGAAMAELPAGVSTAISGAGADAGTALGLMIVVAVGIWALAKVKNLFGSR